MNLKTEAPKFKTLRTGTGIFGAKTVKLSKFKDGFEDSGIITPSHTSIPKEFFTRALAESGMFEDYSKSENPDRIKFNKRELGFLREIFSRFEGYIISIRSDEQTAKGVGLFKTEFVDLRDFDKGFKKCIQSLKQVLAAQFKKDPMAFVKKMIFDVGIGVQIMPVVSNVVSGALTPDLSIAGFTVKDREQVRFSYGFGLTTAVSNSARTKIAKLGRVIELKHCVAMGFRLGDSKLVRVRRSVSLHDLNRKINELMPGLIGIARRMETDFYFEMHLVRGTWFLTQVSDHTWPEVKKPNGREIIRIEGEDAIVGSGVMECTGVYNYVPGEEMPNGSLLRTKHAIDEVPFHELCPASAIIELYLDHRFGFSSHVGGAFRESGIFVMDGQSITGGHMYPKQDQVAKVWADELNGVGGVIV